MKKNDLLKFINRYYLSGATTSVKWATEPGMTKTSFITDDQNVIGSVADSTINLGENKLGVYATPQLIKMLTAVNDDIDININSVQETAVSMDINDTDVDMTFMLADLSVIRDVPELTNTPDWNISIDINSQFIDKFIKAKNALSETENFAVRCNKGVTEIIINYSTINTSRIKFQIDTPDCTDMKTICFSATLFKEILTANKDAELGKLDVSAAGLARASFKSKTYQSRYYLVQLQTA